MGVLTFVNSDSGRRHTAEDLVLAEDLAARAALAVDNARHYEREQRLRTDAERANRLKDEFLATVSHELRTPMTAILGWVRMLQSGNLDQNTAARAVATIERNAASQHQLIEDLLDVSRIITGKLRLDVRPVELAPVISASIDALSFAAKSKEILLQSVLDPGAGPVSGDPERLQQVVWNLISNAVKFTPKGGRVQVLLQRRDSNVEIVVSDTGVGINPKFLPYVFERFRQADGTTTRTHGGLGLGLAIVRHLVELHGGTAVADSAGEGHGSTFTVTLPLMVWREPPQFERWIYPTVSTEPTIPFDNPHWLDGIKVLVVDDEPDARDLLTTILTGCGAEVTAVGSTAEALREIVEMKPDILLSDIGMPEVDGYELIQKIRASEVGSTGKLGAIALTAYAKVEDRIRALSAGYQAHVSKPVDPMELVTVVGSFAGRDPRGDSESRIND
jgi:signal transduction histidine kinase/CheY-like chemotaxis protein